jgi:hypothetical protein
MVMPCLGVLLAQQRRPSAPQLQRQPPPTRQHASRHTHSPAHAQGCRCRLLASCYLAEDFYDVVDIDSFGCVCPPALCV